MNTLVLVRHHLGELVIREYKPQSLAAMWRHATAQADKLFGCGGWRIKHDQSLPGGYIVAADGTCLLIK